MVLGINLKQEQEKDLFVQNDVKKKITTSPPARRESSPTKSNKRLTPRETKASILRKQAQLKKAASLEEKVSCVLCNEIISVRRTNNQNFHGTLPRLETTLNCIFNFIFFRKTIKNPLPTTAKLLRRTAVKRSTASLNVRLNKYPVCLSS